MRTKEQFLELLRAGLWNRPADAALFTTGTDWKGIHELATKHTVIPILADVLERQPELGAPREMKLRMGMMRAATELAHKKLNSTIAECALKLQEGGVDPVLLKGQGLAVYYYNPLRRMCGDIDLYTGEDNFLMACNLLDPGKEVEIDDTINEKHYHFLCDGVDVEIHWTALVSGNRKTDAWVQNWIHRRLDYSAIPHPILKVTTSDGTPVGVRLAPVDFDAVFVFFHLAYHFVNGGIGLRQICDWVMYLHAHAAEIDRERLYTDLVGTGMLRSWQIFSNIAVDKLGLPAEEMPFYTPSRRKYAARMLEKIISVGNFGHHSEDAVDPSLQPDIPRDANSTRVKEIYRNEKITGRVLYRKLSRFKGAFCWFFSVWSFNPKEVRGAIRRFLRHGLTNLLKVDFS